MDAMKSDEGISPEQPVDTTHQQIEAGPQPADAALEQSDAALQTLEAETRPAGQKPWPLWIALALLGLVLLGGAAYLGARLLNGQPGGGQQMMAFAPDSSGGMAVPAGRSIQLKLEPAPEIPQLKADANGVINEIKDRSLFVNSVKELSVAINEDGSTKINSDQATPALEVVVTGDTKIYRDATFDNQKAGENETVQQIVEPIAYSALEENSLVTVWGQKRGDRLIADVILYMRVARVEMK